LNQYSIPGTTSAMIPLFIIPTTIFSHLCDC